MFRRICIRFGKNNGFYGKKHTKECCDKISALNKGRIPPNKGKKMSEEQKNKISKKLSGRKLSKQHVENIKKNSFQKNNKFSANRTGKKSSELHKSRIKESLKKFYSSDKSAETRKQKSLDTKNQFKDGMTKETKERIRQASLKQFKNGMPEETKLKISKSCKGLNNWTKGKRHSDKVKKIISKTSKERWNNEEYAKKVIKSFRNSPNKSENRLINTISNILPKEYKFVGDGDFILGGRCPDFVNINGKKKLIELFGNYWHNEKRTGRPKNEHEKDRIDYFKKYGFNTLVIWENELQNIKKVEEKITEFTKNTK